MMPDAFPTETHPADDLDLDEVGSDFAFGRPCDIPPGVVGDATHMVFTVHWPALLRTVRAYRARVDELEADKVRLAAALSRGEARYDACALALGDCGNKRMAMQRELEQAQAERDHWRKVATLAADCPVDGCDGERIELEVIGKPSFVRLTCGHDETTPATESAPVCPLEPS